MIEFGATLRNAREAKGLTMKDIAEKTNLMVQTVENLENENFTKIAAPIYGRGFVKLYCEAVGIDPKPLIAEFMDIYNGNRPPTIRMKQQETVAKAVFPPVTPTLTSPIPPAVTPPAATTDLPSSSPTVAPMKNESEKPAVKHFDFNEKPSRFVAPKPIEDKKRGLSNFHLSIPPAVWRLLALVCVATLILSLAWMGIRALYNATMIPGVSGGTDPVDVQKAATSDVGSVKTNDPAGKRIPMNLPQLYID